jgi:UDP-3-O-[3-hydroxymyristoyl] N-acetylglucosamine deacetylase
MIFQTTLEQPVLCSGVGLHTGLPTQMTVRPAVPDTGIVFTRRDVEKKVRIRAHIDNVTDATLATTISQDGVKVSTVEHLMAAFAGVGVDNAEVELDAPEVPIMDGSSGPFHALLKNAGVRVQDRSKKFIIVKHPDLQREL